MAIRLGYRVMSGWRLPLSVFLLRDNFLSQSRSLMAWLPWVLRKWMFGFGVLDEGKPSLYGRRSFLRVCLPLFKGLLGVVEMTIGCESQTIRVSWLVMLMITFWICLGLGTICLKGWC